ncbi:putative chitinase [Pseudomonas laurylsulfatiphila]
MGIIAQQLLQILPSARRQAGVFAPALNAAMDRYPIIGANVLPRSLRRSAMSLDN